MSKHWTESKILRVNTLAAVMVAVELQWEMMQPYLPVNFYTAVAFALPIINAVLRVVTTEALTFGLTDAE